MGAIFFAFLALAAGTVRGENRVVSLDGSAALQSFVESSDFAMVEFYAPWCGHCKAFEPVYEEVAEKVDEHLTGVKVAFGKMDAIANAEVAKDNGVKSYPHIAWYVRGRRVTVYRRERKTDAVYTWIKRKTTDVCRDVEDFETARKPLTFGNSKSVVVAVLSEGTGTLRRDLNSAMSDAPDDVACAILTDHAAVSTIDFEPPYLLMIRSADDVISSDMPAQRTHLNFKGIKKWIAIHSLPLVVPFSEETAKSIFSGDINLHLIAFADSTDDANYKEFMDDLEFIAEANRGEIIVVTVDFSDDRILDYFGIDPESDMLPTVRLVQVSDEEGMKKYALADGVNASPHSMQKLIDDFQSGFLQPILKSAPLPEETWVPGTVMSLVGETFEDIARSPEKNVVVKFYAPWCGHCKELAPIYEKVALHYKDYGDVVIAKLDSTANEVAGVVISGFPSIKMFPSGSASSDFIDFKGDRTEEAIISWIDSNSARGHEEL